MVDQNRHEEVGVVLSGGVLRVADWVQGEGPSVRWATNDTHLVEVWFALLGLARFRFRGSVAWQHPHEESGSAPKVELKQGPLPEASWNSGRSWAKASQFGVLGAGFLGSILWLESSIDDIVNSYNNPPGAVGLVPYRKFQRITVEEASL